MTDERTPRENETREASARPSDSWIPASILPDPKPQDGWVFRWVRTKTLGESDNVHVSRMFREGWTPVKAEDHPELMLSSDVGSQFEGNIEVGGLLLCKADEAKMKARTKHFEQVADNQMQSVDNNFLRENDPRMPLLNPERSTRVSSFGKD
jgi:hypothetical protein|tara:strand:+ start:2806 stop:3261 length:456 start_codon:yes stop_codon:yes gene_type:complete